MMTTNNGQKILAQLRAAKKKAPELAEVVDLHHDLLEAQMQVQVPSAHPSLSPEEVQARLSQGLPLLRSQEVTLDWETLFNLYQQVCRIAARHRPDLSAQFERLLKLLDDDPTTVQDLLTSYLDEGDLTATAAGRGTNREQENDQRDISTFVFNHALHPFLRTYADALGPVVKQELWQRGRCPICGGEPNLAFLDEDVGARHLVCSRCDSQWLFPRVKCPFCNTSEPSNLSYYPSEDEKYRLYVCQGCQRYLKTVDLRKARHRVLLPVERITTVALDIAARQEGYR